MAANAPCTSTRVVHTPDFQVDPPSNHVISNPSRAALVVQTFYRTKLQEHEETWRDRYSFLLSRGLKLRFRYKPGWTASWLGTDLDPATCDDSIRQILPMVLDAKRDKDGMIVCIKRIERKGYRTDEVKIGKFLSTDDMLCSPDNHCVPIWDSFCDPILPNVEYIVMPVLRPYNDPPFCAIGEVVDFVTQIIEGMAFIHHHLIAHGDLTTENIMMDARPILPKGWHFVEDQCEPDGLSQIAPLARIDHPVRYIIIDYDCALQFEAGHPHLVTDFSGRDASPPELMTNSGYDAFKVDVFTVGNVLDKDFHRVYDGLAFLEAQINLMKTPDFRQRPTAEVALKAWLGTKDKFCVSGARGRLRKRDESMGERMMLDAVAAAREGIYSVKRMLSPQPSASISSKQ